MLNINGNPNQVLRSELDGPLIVLPERKQLAYNQPLSTKETVYDLSEYLLDDGWYEISLMVYVRVYEGDISSNYLYQYFKDNNPYYFSLLGIGQELLSSNKSLNVEANIYTYTKDRELRVKAFRDSTTGKSYYRIWLNSYRRIGTKLEI